MEYILAGVTGAAVFGLLFVALAIREHRNKKRPPIHTCHQGHTCQCQPTRDTPAQCRKKDAI